MFEYRAGNYGVNNLTDAFRNSNRLIGRNTPRSAAVEATIENPAASIEDKLAAALEWAESLATMVPRRAGRHWVKNAKFIRFRELRVTYTAPQSFARKLGLNNMAFNLSGRNLQIWTPYDGVDPELNVSTGDNFAQGIEAFGTAIPLRYTFAVRFRF